MPYHVYILYSSTRDKFYVGHTGEEVSERLRKHNSDHKGYTGGVGDWKVVFVQSFPDKEAAYRREREIKAWKSKTMIRSLISQNK